MTRINIMEKTRATEFKPVSNEEVERYDYSGFETIHLSRIPSMAPLPDENNVNDGQAVSQSADVQTGFLEAVENKTSVFPVSGDGTVEDHDRDERIVSPTSNAVPIVKNPVETAPSEFPTWAGAALILAIVILAVGYFLFR